MNRREFIRLISATPLLLSSPASLSFTNKKNSRRILVVIELKGGNDGLNTLVPYTQEAYYQKRPRIAIPKSSLIQISETEGMHPSLQGLKKLWDTGNMAWIRGLGYPKQNRSHFKSIDIWDHASFDDDVLDGWLTKHLTSETLTGIAVNSASGPLSSTNSSTLNIQNIKQFLDQSKNIHAIQNTTKNTSLQHILKTQAVIDKTDDNLSDHLTNILPPKFPFPKGGWYNDLHTVYNLISTGIKIPSYKLSLSGFDTHFSQTKKHARLLKKLANGLKIFSQNLQAANCWDEVIIMTYSEFGRRLTQNQSDGTDHGSASPHFILGGKIKGGFYGEYPSLNKLDARGDLIYTTDFRDMYGAILKHWYGINSPFETTLKFV